MLTKQYLVINEYDDTAVAESFRMLRTNIQHYKTDGLLRAIMFTSAGPKEGKSTVVANLAAAFAWSAKKVLVIDCDLRKPIQHRIFGKANRGITDYLVKNADLKSLIQNTGINNLDLLSSGSVRSNSAELLASVKTEKLLAELKREYDYLLIDTPPVMAVTDACVLSSKTDGIILVVAVNTVSPDMVHQVQELIQNANGRICGVVLNRVGLGKDYSPYYNYYYRNERKTADSISRLSRKQSSPKDVATD
jgi:capsular exopolysaccharide synthesis family protein